MELDFCYSINYIVTIRSREYMKNYFSIGELSSLQNISRQTLIFYDKIGLFCPAYTNPDNGYRYYSAGQLNTLDTICILKKLGFSLDEIKAHIQSYTAEDSILALRRQITAIDRQIAQLQMVKSRAEHRCSQLKHAVSIRANSEAVFLEWVKPQSILLQKVKFPYTLEQDSIATKECFARAFREQLPVFFQSGAIIPYRNLLEKRYTESSFVFLPIEQGCNTEGVVLLPEGQCVCTYHIGDYHSTGTSYERLLHYCKSNRLTIVSDSYEFAINDYLSTGDEKEYTTKIMLYVQADSY